MWFGVMVACFFVPYPLNLKFGQILWANVICSYNIMVNFMVVLTFFDDKLADFDGFFGYKKSSHQTGFCFLVAYSS